MTRKFLQLQEQYLAGGGAGIGDTTLILKSFKTIDGVNITNMEAYFGSKAFGTIEPGKGTREEQITFTGITTNGDGTVSLTGVSSVLFESPYTETPGLTKQHAGGVVFVISNTSGLYADFIVASDDYNITGQYNFTTQPTITIDSEPDGNPDDPATPQGIPTKYYVDKKKQEVVDMLDDYLPNTGGTMSGDIVMDDNRITGLPLPTSSDLDQPATVEYANALTYAGAPNASETVKGIVEIATQAQVDSGTDTGETGAPLVLSPSKAPSTVWRSTKTYQNNDIVHYLGNIYKSGASSNLNNVPGTNTISFTPFEVQNARFISMLSLVSNGKLKFKNNGLIAYGWNGSTQLTKYTMSTAGDLRTITSTTTYTVSSLSGAHAFDVSEDGLSIFYAYDGGTVENVTRLTTAIAHNFTTTTATGVIRQINGTDNSCSDICVNHNGTKIFGFISNNSFVAQMGEITMTTGYDLSTGTYTLSSYTLPANEKYLFYSAGFIDDYNKFFTIGVNGTTSPQNTNYVLRVYNLATRGDFDSIVASSVRTLDFIPDADGTGSVSPDGNFTYIGGNELMYANGNPFWLDANNPLGNITSVTLTSASSYEITTQGFLSCNFIASTTTKSIGYLNGIQVSIESTENTSGSSSDNDKPASFSLPVKSGDKITFSNPVNGIIAIRQY